MIPGYGTLSSNTPDEILASGDGIVTLGVTVKSGENLVKGTVVARDSVSGKYVAYAPAGSYSSDVAVGILSEKIDASLADQQAVIYIAGVFVVGKLTGYDAAALVDFLGRRIGTGSGSTDIIIF